MKRIILSLIFLLPICSHAAPKWELISVIIEKPEEEKLTKIYLDKNSIKTNDGNIRSYDAKRVTHDGQTAIVNNFIIMCSKGLTRLPTEKNWSHIFTRSTVFANTATYSRIAFQSVCSDRPLNDLKTIEFDSSVPDYW